MTNRTAALLGTLACTASPGAFAVDSEIKENTTLSVFGEFNIGDYVGLGTIFEY